MQTFLPYPDFAASAEVLDTRRLGKQRVECLQLLRALSGASKGWRGHPAARMWQGCEVALGLYGVAVCLEWRRRGYKDTCLEKITDEARRFDDAKTPSWFGDEDFHSRHRAALLFKNPAHYSKFGWTEAPEINYKWPFGDARKTS